MAQFARMLAEDEAEYSTMRSNVRTADLSDSDANNDCSVSNPGGSTTTITAEDNDSNGVQFEWAKFDPIQSDTTHMKIFDEAQGLRAMDHELNIKIDQLAEKLEAKSLAHSEALVRIQSQDEQLKMDHLANEAALHRIEAYKGEVNMLQLKLNTLQNENQQLKMSPATVAGLMYCNTKSRNESNVSDKAQIEGSPQDHLRIVEVLRRKDDVNATLLGKMLQSANKISLLQFQLGLLNTAQTQLDDRNEELKTLKGTVAALAKQRNDHFVKLCAVRAELHQAQNTNENHCKEIATLKVQAAALQSDREETRQLKRSIALAITQLDLVYHDHAPVDIRDIVDELFRDWHADEKFVDEYHAERQFILNHHQAHERDDRGRGEPASYLQGLFNTIDSRRDVPFRYN
ncbi:hypothetical protein PMIN01_01160 [Paraphaeosphaeria minitans]|uniref:Uncharacterized protein n=1 Tax=Paraphaeosphaeria minitans TaxID=565426 RepID=A0A9P6GTL3_9PLEO|nr:hypothetical protein PMIN01_01160 [Paraphaeosphaeria minitans]